MWLNASDFIKINKAHTSVYLAKYNRKKLFIDFGGMKESTRERERNKEITDIVNRISYMKSQMLSANLKWIRFTDCL